MKQDFVEKVDGYKPIYKGIPPFMKYEKGYGYYGVLLEEETTGKLQCHLCGESALNLAKHLFHKHKDVSPREYKVETGLNLGTPLMSEKTRKLIRNNFLELTDEKKEKVIARLKNLNKELHERGDKKQRENVASIQTNNRYGTCPEQVKSQFLSIYNSLGRIPNYSELTRRLRYITETRFGSYEEALVVWGIPRTEYKAHLSEASEKAKDVRRENNYYPKYTDEEVKKIYMNYFAVNKRFPTWGEVIMNGMPGRVPFQRVFKMPKSAVEKMLIGI